MYIRAGDIRTCPKVPHGFLFVFLGIKFNLVQVLKMVRNYKRKRETCVNKDDLKRAMEHVLNKTLKLREAAAIFGITKSTLGYRIKLFKNNQKSKGEDFSSKYSVYQVLTRFEEDMLEKYILKSSKMNYGLTYQQTRLLAYQYAKV